MNRAVTITNRHPRLRVPRAAVARAIAILDEEFRILPRDLAHLSLSRARRSALQSRIENPKSKILVGCPPGELSLVFLTDPALAQIHADFMGDPTATDVITFEGNSMALASGALAQEAGEICVSADRAFRYVEGPRPSGPRKHLSRSRLAGTRALQAAFSAELTLYLVHGWLHLAGYDDLQPAKKRRMRAAEKRAMQLLQAARAVPAFRLV